MTQPTWGIVATIKAPPRAVLDFAAHHLDLGAHRLFIYLDDDNPAAFDALKAHPKCRPLLTDDAYWRKLGMKRRVKHQSRQFENARHAYGRAIGQVDWLAHIDVDEFLWPDRPMSDQLAALPETCMGARIRPAEALAGEGPVTHFKTCAADRPTRDRQTAAIWPDYGAHLNGGFLSHVAGKMIYRTGIDGLKVQIHNIWVHDKMNPGETTLADTTLLHMHAESWPAFRAALEYRLEKGSYRAELKPGRQGALTMHALLQTLRTEGGEDAIRQFYDAVCTARPDLLARLREHGLLRSHALELDRKRARHFPGIAACQETIHPIFPD
ncbi:glycosyltransferase family 2 protein [Lutimaribacter sp. EGI FJ00015]|uniref:Glycosyltransferase family 2 protein n=1 Tax=Lutimaribacter degradans TaxID=2945989 RepID=A0ACC5ZS58_9RHOB|nr:glycosyltransferase family 2 protein [Lutimaribacter sp. EGI FJ00013]MCM2560881.1 glycosyltransferase family 2 protein [Lutimaribacter sp. EGI FJ00013]MCO0612174.1 glycosyltransferase family 2 protein [Lutimaribacter sp. EGI FJ00015]MCO0634706.1 glycosyltransferase family 2 protein [Lutimaribacter sp. EGI FJ00014]